MVTCVKGSSKLSRLAVSVVFPLVFSRDERLLVNRRFSLHDTLCFFQAVLEGQWLPENASNSPTQLWTRLRLVVMAANGFRKALAKRNALVSFDSDDALNDALASKMGDAQLVDRDISPLNNENENININTASSSANRDNNLLISIETEATPSDVGGVTSVGGVSRQQPIAQGMNLLLLLFKLSYDLIRLCFSCQLGSRC